MHVHATTSIFPATKYLLLRILNCTCILSALYFHATTIISVEFKSHLTISVTLATLSGAGGTGRKRVNV